MRPAVVRPNHPNPVIDSRAMGYRLSKIYTRTGDDGTTGLGDGHRIDKSSARIAAIGAVDEANACIGLLLAAIDDAAIGATLTQIQHRLFNLGAELSLPGHAGLRDQDITVLEHQLDDHNAGLLPLREFILPGGGEAAARCHLARTVVRRAERAVVALGRQDTGLRAQPVRYLNRLSDLLFVLARVLARADDHAETPWKHDRQPR